MTQTIGLSGAVLLLAFGAFATHADAQQAQREPLVWTAKGVDPPPSELSLAEARRRLEALEVEVGAARDFKAAERALAELWKLATYGDHPEQMNVLKLLAEARSELLNSLEQTDRAGRVWEEVWIRKEDVSHYGWVPANFRTANEVERAAEAQLLSDGKFVAGRQRPVEENFGRASRDDDPVYFRLTNALRDANGGLIRELGPLAVEPLKVLSVESIDDFIMSPDQDPLKYLAELVGVEALELCLEHIDSGGYFWRRRILRQLERRAPVEEIRPTWSRILETCLADRDLVPDVIGILKSFAGHDALTPEMHAGLLAYVADNSADGRAQLSQLLGKYRGRSSVEGLVDALLLSPHVELAELGAMHALYQADLNPLRTLVAHESSVVRSVLAQSLRRRVYSELPNVQPILQPGDVDLLVRLTADPDDDVRTEAAYSVRESSLKGEVPNSVFLELAADPFDKVRLPMTQVKHPDTELLTELFVALAADSNEFVERALLHRIQTNDWGAEAPARLAALVVIFERRSEWLGEENSEVRNQFIASLWGALRGPFVETVAWVARVRDDWLTCQTLTAFELGGWNAWPFESADATDLAYLMAQAPRLSGRLKEWTSKDPEKLEFRSLLRAFETFQKLESKGRSIPVDAVRLLAGLTDLPPEFRAGALGTLRDHWDDQLTAWFFETLRARDWEYSEEPHRSMFRAFEAIAADATVLAIVEDRAILDGIAQGLVRSYARTGDVSIELAQAILERWLEVEWSKAVIYAIQAYGHHPDVDDGGLLEREALGVRYPKYAILALDRRRDPATFPTLARCLRADWLAPGSLRQSVRTAAAAALTNSLSDEAARLLLAELEATDDDEFRAVLLDSLQTIRTYQDEQATWRRRLAEKELRADAIVELIAILDDPTAEAEVRGEAARALGTLGAIETLPRLVRLLRAEEPAVRAGAREALDRLNRPTEPAPRRQDADAGSGEEK